MTGVLFFHGGMVTMAHIISWYREQLVPFVSMSLPKASSWTLLHQNKTSASSPLNFRNESTRGQREPSGVPSATSVQT